MNDNNLQFALREMRTIMGRPQTIVILTVVILICVVSGPFGTNVSLGNLARFSYWAVLVVSTYVLGTLLHFLMVGRGDDIRLVRYIKAAGVASGVIATYISVLNVLAIPTYPTDLPSRIGRFGITFLIAMAISATFYVILVKRRVPDFDQQCLLMDKIPHAKRGGLISLHAEDHYVRVETHMGSEMILLRLSDAIALTAPFVGVQVHRSHWIVIDHVRDYDKTDGTWNVILSNGRRVPISRGYRADAITAGIIPARG